MPERSRATSGPSTSPTRRSPHRDPDSPRPPRADAFAENVDLIHPDTGCEHSPSCLRCPLPTCKYDAPFRTYPVAAAAARELRATGATGPEIARALNISIRTAYRYLSPAPTAPIRPLTCEHRPCGRVFVPARRRAQGRHHFCSRRCARRFWSQRGIRAKRARVREAKNAQGAKRDALRRRWADPELLFRYWAFITASYRDCGNPYGKPSHTRIARWLADWKAGRWSPEPQHATAHDAVGELA